MFDHIIYFILLSKSVVFNIVQNLSDFLSCLREFMAETRFLNYFSLQETAVQTVISKILHCVVMPVEPQPEPELVFGTNKSE